MREQQHFSTAELAGLPGMPGTARGVHKVAKREQWSGRQRAARGGGFEYPLSCLPAETQAALAEKVISAASTALALPPLGRSTSVDAILSSTRGVMSAPGRNQESGGCPDPRSESLARIYEARSDKQKAKARAALDAVMQYHDLVDAGVKVKPAIAAVSAARSIAPATLSRFLCRIKGEPRDLWLYLLLSGHAGRTACAEMSAEAWEVLKADYLSKPARTAQACIERLREANRKGGMDWTLPSDRTMERRLQNMPRDVKVLARQGRDELLRLFPAQRRAKAALAALDTVNGDGFAHKGIWVQFEDGEIRRARTWFWADVYSSKILAWRTAKTEDTETVRLSFDGLVRDWGIPRAVLIDNTRAAANKTMSGGVSHRYRFKVKEEEPAGVFKLLGVAVHWATPGHGQAKPIERMFGIGGMHEYVDRAPEFHGAFDDSDTYNGKTRPVPIAQLRAVIAREVAAMNARERRRGAIHQGRSWDAVFAESYARITVRRATEEQRRLLLLCTEPTRVHRDATITLDAGRMVGEHRANRYWNKDLQDYVGKLVAARFDPEQLHEGVHLYTADGRYIGFGDCMDPAGFHDHAAAREQARDRKTFMRGARQALEASVRMTARKAGEITGTARAGETADVSIPAPKLIEPLFNQLIERPRYQPKERTDAEREELAQYEAIAPAAETVNVLELSDPDKHSYWKKLDARRASGETLAELEEAHWSNWQQQSYFIEMTRMEREFEEDLRSRKVG